MSYQTLYSMPCRLPCQRYMNVNSVFEASAKPSKESFDGGEYEPTISREAYEYEPTISQELYEYEPTVSGEMYTDIADAEAKCDCAPRNRPYRMESCGYNQSPTWDYHRSFNGGVARSATMEGFEMQAENGTDSANCGCAPSQPPYRMEKCGYNQSPTWTNQASFRQTLQDRPF